VDHQVLSYLVNKPIITSRITKWLLLLQEFDFKIIFKLSRVHFLPNQLSIINHGELAIGVENQLHDAQLLSIKFDLYGQIIDYFKKSYFHDNMPKEKRSQWVTKTKPYTYDGHLHKLRPNGILRQFVTPIEAFKVLEEFHERPIGGYYGSNTIVKKIMSIGYWWLTIHKYTTNLCQKCDIYQQLKLMWQSGKGRLKPIMAFEPFYEVGFKFCGTYQTHS